MSCGLLRVSSPCLLLVLACAHADPRATPEPGVPPQPGARTAPCPDHSKAVAEATGERLPPAGTPPYPAWCTADDCRDLWDEKGRSIFVESVVKKNHGSAIRDLPDRHAAVVLVDEEGETRYWQQRGRQDGVHPDWLRDVTNARRDFRVVFASAKRSVRSEARHLLDTRVRVARLCGSLVEVDATGVTVDQRLLRQMGTPRERGRVAAEIARAVDRYWAERRDP